MTSVRLDHNLRQAMSYHRAGRLEAAEQLYREVLAHEPDHPEALHLLGVLAGQQGKTDIAVDLLGRSIAANPGNPEPYINLGNALRIKGLLKEPIAACRQAIALQPRFPGALSNLGVALTENGQLDEAIVTLREAIALEPGNAAALGDRIDDSSPAPLLTVVAGPSPESKQVGIQKKELAERHLLRMEFWKRLLDKARTKTPIFANRNPTDDNWISASSGKNGLTYSYVVRMEDAQVELSIDRGDVDQNKHLFEKLFEQKEQIESAFGKPLEWQRLDDRRACRVRYLITRYGLKDKDHWADLQEILISEMVNFYNAMQPELTRLK